MPEGNAMDPLLQTVSYPGLYPGPKSITVYSSMVVFPIARIETRLDTSDTTAGLLGLLIHIPQGVGTSASINPNIKVFKSDTQINIHSSA